MVRRPARDRDGPVPAPPDRVATGALEADRPVDVGVQDVLPRAAERPRSASRSLLERPGSCEVDQRGGFEQPVRAPSTRARRSDRVARTGRRRPRPAPRRGSVRAASCATSNVTGWPPRTAIVSDRTSSGSHAPSNSAAVRSSFSRSRYRSWTSPVTFVNPHAWCSVIPIATPGANGNATPRASYPGARRWISNHAAGCWTNRCGSFARSGLPARGPPAGHHPVVRSLPTGAGHPVEQPSAERARGELRWNGRSGRQEDGRRLRTEPLDEERAQRARGPSCPTAPTPTYA